MKVYLVTSLWVNEDEISSDVDVFATREAALEFLNKSIESELQFWREDLNFNFPADVGKEGLSYYQINWDDDAGETITEIDTEDVLLYPNIIIDRTPTSFCIHCTDRTTWVEYNYEEREIKE